MKCELCGVDRNNQKFVWVRRTFHSSQASQSGSFVWFRYPAAIIVHRANRPRSTAHAATRTSRRVSARLQCAAKRESGFGNVLCCSIVVRPDSTWHLFHMPDGSEGSQFSRTILVSQFKAAARVVREQPRIELLHIVFARIDHAVHVRAEADPVHVPASPGRYWSRRGGTITARADACQQAVEPQLGRHHVLLEQVGAKDTSSIRESRNSTVKFPRHRASTPAGVVGIRDKRARSASTTIRIRPTKSTSGFRPSVVFALDASSIG